MQKHEQFKNTLIDLKTQLTNELSTIAAYNKKTGDWEVRMDDVVIGESDSNAAADFDEEADERIATLSELETRYRNVLRALDKIETGTFGICEVSGETIEMERLEANPAARTCISHREEEYDLPL